MIVRALNLRTVALRAGQVLQSLLWLLTDMRNRLYKLDRGSHEPLMGTMLHAAYQRSYGLSLAIHAILLCARRALPSEDFVLDDEVARLCSQALQLADEARLYRPLRAFWLVSALMPVWCATRDADTIAKIESVILEYRRYEMVPIGIVPKDQLEWMAKRLSLRF